MRNNKPSLGKFIGQQFENEHKRFKLLAIISFVLILSSFIISFAVSSVASGAIIVGDITYKELLQNLKELFINLGVGLIGAIIVFYFIERFLGNKLLLFQIEEKSRLNVRDFLEDMKDAKEVKILDIYMHRLLINRFTEVQQALTEAVTINQAQVQILVANPRSLTARERAENILKIPNYKELFPNAPTPTTVEYILEEMEKCLRLLQNIYDYVNVHLSNSTQVKEEDHKLQIKLYNVPTPIAMHQCDEFAYWSFFPLSKLSADSPQLKIPVGTPVGEILSSKFSELWQHPETEYLSKYLNINKLDSKV
ncbi:MAG: hypothetical protein LCI00_32780 [Chloroflexi bacterium]|nr:hypothetical protein [Chloroflexota bacterium]MCC6895459.1 hypothetical protein [Anaerolineae bacterium]